MRKPFAPPAKNRVPSRRRVTALPLHPNLWGVHNEPPEAPGAGWASPPTYGQPGPGGGCLGNAPPLLPGPSPKPGQGRTEGAQGAKRRRCLHLAAPRRLCVPPTPPGRGCSPPGGGPEPPTTSPRGRDAAGTGRGEDPFIAVAGEGQRRGVTGRGLGSRTGVWGHGQGSGVTGGGLGSRAGGPSPCQRPGSPGSPCTQGAEPNPGGAACRGGDGKKLRAHFYLIFPARSSCPGAGEGEKMLKSHTVQPGAASCPLPGTTG